jgi:hypothetical protein
VSHVPVSPVVGPVGRMKHNVEFKGEIDVEWTKDKLCQGPLHFSCSTETMERRGNVCLLHAGRGSGANQRHGIEGCGGDRADSRSDHEGGMAQGVRCAHNHRGPGSLV